MAAPEVPAAELPGADRDDPFVELLRWVVRTGGDGDVDRVADGSGVAARTLRQWLAGDYPRQRSSQAVRTLHDWALSSISGYPPPASGGPALTDLAGPSRLRPPTSAITPPAPPTARRPWLLPVIVGLALLVVVGGVVGGLVASRGGPPRLPGAPVGGALYPETTGSIGAKAFGSPRGPNPPEEPVAAKTTYDISCRLLDRSIASVSPDGYWYLIASGPQKGLWSPANSWLNGDPPKGPFMHNTDFAVPLCR